MVSWKTKPHWISGGREMDIDQFEKEIKKDICEEISLAQINTNKFRVITPFQFDDGDHIKIILKKVGADWVLTDEGHTLMHLNYYLDEDRLLEGNRERIIFETIENLSLKYDQGRIFSKIDEKSIGNKLFKLIQGIIQIDDVMYISREQDTYPFLEDVKSFIYRSIAGEHITENWTHPQLDPEKEFIVDFKINGMNTPLFIFRLSNEYRVLKAAITLYEFNRIKFPNQSIGIYRDLDKISPKNKKKFSRLCNAEFTNFYDQQDGIIDYFNSTLPQGYVLA